MTAADLAQIIRGYKFRYATEFDVHRCLEAIFKLAVIDYQHEVVLGPRDRIDFVVDRVGLEVKIDGSHGQVLRQLERYAKFPQFDTILLVTRKMQHAATMPSTLNDKPLSVVSLESSAL